MHTESSTYQQDWLVLYTKSRNEKKVADLLQQHGFEAYCPTKRQRRQWSDRIKWIEEPLFKSYCFVRIDEKHRQEVFRIPGVVCYVYWLGQPAVVRAAEIERIKLYLNDFDHQSIRVKYFQPGDEVMLQSGSFMHERGVLIEQRGRILKLKLMSLGVMITVDTRHNIVEKLAS